MIWTAAGLYAAWRLVARPLLRASYLIALAAWSVPVALIRLLAGVRVTDVTPAPAPPTGGYRLSDHPLDPGDITRAEGYRHPPKP